jgi:CheY-like chemotaxis protein
MGNRGILIVEDNANDVDLLLLALGREGVTSPVVIVGTGREAIAHLAAALLPPRLIVLDAVLPDMAGTQVLKLLRDDLWTRDIPVVLFAGVERRGDAETAHRFNADLLVKPAAHAELREIVSRLRSQWLTPSTEFIKTQMRERWGTR